MHMCRWKRGVACAPGHQHAHMHMTCAWHAALESLGVRRGVRRGLRLAAGRASPACAVAAWAAWAA